MRKPARNNLMRCNSRFIEGAGWMGPNAAVLLAGRSAASPVHTHAEPRRVTARRSVQSDGRVLDETDMP